MSDRNSNIECIYFYRFSDMGADIHGCRLRDNLFNNVFWSDPPCKICKRFIKRNNVLKILVENTVKDMSEDEKKNYNSLT